MDGEREKERERGTDRDKQTAVCVGTLATLESPRHHECPLRGDHTLYAYASILLI